MTPDAQAASPDPPLSSDERPARPTRLASINTDLPPASRAAAHSSLPRDPDSASEAAGWRASKAASRASPSSLGSVSPSGSAARAVAFSAADDIEMGPLAGHRRRKSSLLAPLSTQQQSATGPGHRHVYSPSTTLPGEPEIPEIGGRAAEAAGAGKSELDRDSFSDEDLHDDEEIGLADRDRRRKQKKRARNMRLDQRIVPEQRLSSDEWKEADKSVIKRLAVNLVLILLWYLFSLSISLYNKWMFDERSLNFAFPLFTTSMHMLVQFSLATLVLYFVPSLRPQQGHSSDQGRSRHESEPSSTSSLMTKMFYLTRIGPCGTATGLDIGLGNTSLKFISLTFYTMCKSSSLVFVLLFAFLFRLETPTWRLVAIIATMTLGVILMVFGEIEFELGGFFLVMSSAFFSGFRWGLTQILLLRNAATSNPFSSIFFLTPVMFLTLLILAILLEGFGPLLEGLRQLSEEWGTILTPLFLMIPGCIAFCMTASEFALLQRTSVVTLSIAGIFKEVLTISAASLVFKDELTFINFVGLLTTMAAIVAYNYVKITKMRHDAQADVHSRNADRGDTSSSSNNASDADNDEATSEAAGLLLQAQPLGGGDTLSSADRHKTARHASPHALPPGEYKEHTGRERED